MKKYKKRKYFKPMDLIIYSFFIMIFAVLIYMTLSMSSSKATKAEIYVNGKLQYVYPLLEEEKDVFVDTDIGGVNVRFKDKMVCVTSSNSPQKLCVKQGWIKDPGQLIIGVPDKLVIKIIGDPIKNSVDYIIK